MSTISGGVLAGSTDGKPINITATSSPGTTIHQAGASGFDELWIYCYNSDWSADHYLYVLWGGVTGGDTIKYKIEAGKEKLVIQGPKRISGAILVAAYADVAGVLYCTGGFNRIS